MPNPLAVELPDLSQRSPATPVPGQLADGPSPNAQWTEVPEALNTAKKLKALQKTWTEFLYGGAKLALLESHPKLNLRSAVGEDVQTFLARCKAAAHKQAQAELKSAEAEYTAARQKLVAQMPARAAPPRSVRPRMRLVDPFPRRLRRIASSRAARSRRRRR